MGYRQRRDRSNETAGKKCAEMLASSGEILGKLPEVFPPLTAWMECACVVTSEFSIKRRIIYWTLAIRLHHTIHSEPKHERNVCGEAESPPNSRL